MAFLQEYTMLDELGNGGFATVYKVRHNELGYIRAIRVLKENIVAKSGDDPKSSEAYQKFLAECKVLLRLGNGNHPSIVHIYKPDLLENKALVEMDYIDGEDLFHYLKRNQNFIPFEEVLRMAIQMSSALAYCHEDIYRFCMDKNLDNLQDDPDDGTKVLLDEKTRSRLIERYKIIHNDIHPGNIMRREDGNYVLLDFGLAIEGDEVVRSSRRKKGGVPEYKAPEKWDNESNLTEQSDIYSFGVVLYKYLAGRVPFPYNTKNSNGTAEEYRLMNAHRTAMPPSIEAIRREQYEKKFPGKKYERDYPQWLEDAIMKCLRKDPNERFRNGKELYDYIIAESKKNNNGYYDVEIARLTSTNRDLSSQVTDLSNINNSLSSQLNEVQDSLKQTQQELGSAQNDVAVLNDKLMETKKKASKRLPIALAIILIIIVGLLGASVSYVAVDKKKSAEVKSLNDAISQKDIQIKELNEAQSTILPGDSKEIAKLKNSVKQKDEEISKLNNEIQTLKNQSSSSNSAEIADLKKQRDQKIKELDEANKKIAKLNGEIQTLKNQSSSNNSAEIADLKKQRDQKIKELDVANKKIDKLNGEIQTLKKQSPTSNYAEFADYKKQLYQKEAEINQQKAKIYALENEIKLLKFKQDSTSK